MELLAFTHIAMDYETPHSSAVRTLSIPSITRPSIPSARWLGLTTAAISLAIMAAAPGAIALVRLGDTGDDVSSLQQGLQQAGYPVGVVDGVFGSGTENALISFQTEYGLVADGIAGPSTLAKLAEVNTAPDNGGTSASITTLNPGDSGDAVTVLQTKLKELGFFPNAVEVTGYYGGITVDAVKRFQQANSLGADGIAGPSTQARLFGADAVSQSDAATAQTAATPTDVTTAATPASSSRLLVFGETSAEVVALQNRLKVLGYFPSNLNSTGYFGSLTLNAVKAFQTKNGLTADGVVGSVTAASLNSTTAIAATSDPVVEEPAAAPPAEDESTNESSGGSTGGANPTEDSITPGKTITIRTNGGPLNVRSAPNTVSSTIKGTLANGTSVEATGSMTGDWIEISDGWIHKDYVEIPQ